jgi:hypothetical protein
LPAPKALTLISVAAVCASALTIAAMIETIGGGGIVAKPMAIEGSAGSSNAEFGGTVSASSFGGAFATSTDCEARAATVAALCELDQPLDL